MLRTSVIILLFFSLNLFSEENENRSIYGVYGDYILNYHLSDFTKLPGIPNCCKKFESGTGSGIRAGLLYEIPVSDFYIGFRLGINQLDAKLEASETTTIIKDGQKHTGIFNHILESKYTGLEFNYYFTYLFTDKLRVNAGFSNILMMKTEFSQMEKLTGPGTFLDSLGNDTKRAIRNEFSGSIPEYSTFLFGFNGNISYQLPLNKSNTLNMNPEIGVNMFFNNINKQLEWKVMQVFAGVSIKYSPQPKPEIIEIEKEEFKVDTVKINSDEVSEITFKAGIERIQYDVFEDDLKIVKTKITSITDTLIYPVKYLLEGKILAYGVDESGKETERPVLKMEEFIQSRLQPLLNYIFFDENSYSFDKRYVILNKNETEKFNENQLFFNNTLETYYNILNIIGKRLAINPGSKIKLIGCNDGYSSEKNNIELSKNRADEVKKYLTDVWQIEADRISIETKNLPEKASTPVSEIEKMQENRRVEIQTNDYEILKPLFLTDTVRKSNISALRFKTSTNSEAGLKELELIVKQNEQIIKKFNEINDNNKINAGNSNKDFDWNLEEDQEHLPKFDKPISYELNLNDFKNQTYITKGKDIDFEVLTITKKRTEGIADKIIDKYSLILFEFDKADIENNNRKILDFVKSRIGKNSTVKIEGFTDKTGEAEYNKKLSERRAAAVQNALSYPNSTSIGIGEEILLHNNDLPEGRFYCRTVDITVETSIENK